MAMAFGRPDNGRRLQVSTADRSVPMRPRERGLVTRLARRIRAMSVLQLIGWCVLVAATGALAVTLALGERPPPPGPDTGAPAARSGPGPAEAFAVKPTPAIEALAEARPIWVEVARPIAVFGVTAPDLGATAHRYEARRHGAGGRDDVLLFGDFSVDAPHVRLSAYRPGGEAPPPGTFFVDLVRNAAEAGLAVGRATVPAAVDTKFGPVEMAEAVFLSGGVSRACVALRLDRSEAGLRLSGWACGTGARPIDHRRLACILNGLELLAPGEEPGLRALFAAAARRRGQVCGAGSAGGTEGRRAG
ncbi:hypothetical protein QNA08_15865 [Chelatococcus sp. SYSU_G07232]|uniref:Uncharacterized protein n=1 Tax=Chelatococcus albus TaxID=3047466 RepID=A0ABT7AMA5_9HYPH|nr:hypothetical protein [Chelatococcus sp. SYSU_G07232]MDJ1159701.1 hypothetical protein [Chelatococcus sp. SYSU_G07232]